MVGCFKFNILSLKRVFTDGTTTRIKCEDFAVLSFDKIKGNLFAVLF